MVKPIRVSPEAKEVANSLIVVSLTVAHQSFLEAVTTEFTRIHPLTVGKEIQN